MVNRIFLLRLVETPVLSSKEALQMCYRIGNTIPGKGSTSNMALHLRS